MGGALVKGLLLGLSTGGFCLGACAPALLPYLMSHERLGGRALVRRGAEFLTGRLLSYLLLAVLTLTVGARVHSSPLTTKVAAGVMLLLAVLLVLYGLSRNFPEWRICRLLERSGALRRFPFLAGLALGANVCPPLLLAFTYVLTVGQWGPGLGFAAAFFVGSSVYLMPVFFSGYLGRLASLRGAAEVAAIFSGLWFAANAVALWKHGGM